jgi:hypothetical protein
MNVEQFTTATKEIAQRHDDEWNALGDRVRQEIVEPACKKHRLRFTSGMGVFFFERRAATANDMHYGDRQDVDNSAWYIRDKLSASARATLGPILDLLNVEVSWGHCLGHYVGDVP